MSSRIPVLIAALVCFSTAALAQAPLQLQISGGRVTLHAENVPVRTILAEWARLGGAQIVNGDRVAGAPVTLELEGVPERQALEIVLRGVSGYVLAARQPGVPGASMYDRIMILPTSVAPRVPTPAAPGQLSSPAVRPAVPQQPDDQNGIDVDAAQGNDGVPLGRPVPIPRPVVGGVPVAVPGNPPAMPPIVVPDNQPQQQQPGVVVTPSNPFGLPAGSSARPGVITPPTQQQQQTPPRPGPQD